MRRTGPCRARGARRRRSRRTARAGGGRVPLAGGRGEERQGARARVRAQPIRRSFFNQRGDEVSPIDNDNYFFNVSHTMGERVTCSLLRGAGEVFGKGTTLRDGRGECATFANDALRPPGADTAP